MRLKFFISAFVIFSALPFSTRSELTLMHDGFLRLYHSHNDEMLEASSLPYGKYELNLKPLTASGKIQTSFM